MANEIPAFRTDDGLIELDVAGRKLIAKQFAKEGVVVSLRPTSDGAVAMEIVQIMDSVNIEGEDGKRGGKITTNGLQLVFTASEWSQMQVSRSDASADLLREAALILRYWDDNSLDIHYSADGDPIAAAFERLRLLLPTARREP